MIFILLFVLPFAICRFFAILNVCNFHYLCTRQPLSSIYVYYNDRNIVLLLPVIAYDMFFHLLFIVMRML